METRNDVPLNAEKYEDADVMLDQIEQALRIGSSPESRLMAHIDMARPELLAALLANGDPTGFNTVAGYETSQCLLYCLLQEDWANLTEVAETVPGAKARLMEILHINDADWDELRSCTKCVDDVFFASEVYLDALMRAFESVHITDLEVA